MREAGDLKRALKEIERVWGPGGSVYQMTARQRKARGLASCSPRRRALTQKCRQERNGEQAVKEVKRGVKEA
jgi:ubiquinone/menaquinone biosynthesis C-methylase UbiE